MKKIISLCLLLIVSLAVLTACSSNIDTFYKDSAELYTTRTEVLNYFQGTGEMTAEEVAADLITYCERIGDCTFGTGVCDGTGAGRCIALGLSDDQIAEYVAQRKFQLDAYVADGTLTQEEADLMLQTYEEMLKNRANTINANQQKGLGVCQNEGTCSGMGNGNNNYKGRGRNGR